VNDVDVDELLKAFEEGRPADCSRNGAPGLVDAELVRRCCVDGHGQVDPRGIRLLNAVVTGGLDLAGLEVSFPLCFDMCEFDSPLHLDGARLHALAVTRCSRVPGLLGNGLRVRRDLDLSQSTVTGAHLTSASTSGTSAIWLCEAEIGGRLLCKDTRIDAEGNRSIQADRIRVGGTVRFIHEFTATREIRLLGARIDGSLDLTGASIASAPGSTGPALDLGDAVIGGSLFVIPDRDGRRPAIDGRVDMGSTRISGQLLIRGAVIKESGGTPVDSGYSSSRLRGTALSALRLTVGAEMTLEGACQIQGGIDLSMSDLGSFSVGGDCSLRADGGTALDLANSELRGGLAIASGVTVSGTVTVAGAHIRGDLTLRGVALQGPGLSPPATAGPGAATAAAGPGRHDPGGHALIADGARLGGSAYLSEGFTAGGPVSLAGAEIGGRLTCGGARLDGTDKNGYALIADRITVAGDVELNNGFVAAGAVRLPGATITRALACGRAQLNGCDRAGVALLAGGISASSLYLNEGFTAAGAIWLRSARVHGSAYLEPQRLAPDLAVDAAHAHVGGTLSWIPGQHVEGKVSLEGAVAGLLADDWHAGRGNGFWPARGRLHLDGFTYGRIGGSRAATVAQRLDWIRSQYDGPPGGNRARPTTQPYEQLAAVYRNAGQDAEARTVAIARRSDQRRFGNLSLGRWVGNWLMDKSIKYGYRTGRAAAGLVLLYLAVFVLSIIAQHHGVIIAVGNTARSHTIPSATMCTRDYPCFYPAGYASDIVIPIINLHQSAYWGVDGSAPWGWAWILGTWTATGLGWALATLLVAGYTGLARRQ
jgi:hypothetical protein